MSFLIELWQFMRVRKKFWLAPILVVLLVFGGLIIFFLIVEPNGLARLWQIGKEKLRLWPFPH